MHVLKGNKYAFTFQASPFNLLESIQANLGVNWVSRTFLEHGSLSDSNIVLMVNASSNYHFLWQCSECTLSEKPLWLLVYCQLLSSLLHLSWDTE